MHRLSKSSARNASADHNAAVRRWIANTTRQSAAAATLLLEHDYWLRRPDFIEAAARYYPQDEMLAICWDDAARIADTAHASTSELTVLALAAAIGSDRYRLSNLGTWNAAAVTRAVAAAAGAR